MENAKKMNDQINLMQCEWSDDAALMLQSAVNNCSILDIELQVKRGAVLFKIELSGDILGYYVLRVDKLQSHNEGVIVVCVADHKQIDLTMSVLPMIEKQFTNCASIRIHTARCGLVKKLSNSGYEPQEFVMRKALNV